MVGAADCALSPARSVVSLAGALELRRVLVSSCAENEAKGENVIGVSGDGQCVSYTPDPKPSSWERANDGTCETSTDPVRELFVLALFRHVSKSSVKLKRVVDQRVLEFGQVRAKWATQKACESSSKRDGFVCVQSPTQGREFCSSTAPGLEYGAMCPAVATNLTCVKAKFSNLDACQAQCFVSA